MTLETHLTSLHHHSDTLPATPNDGTPKTVVNESSFIHTINQSSSAQFCPYTLLLDRLRILANERRAHVDPEGRALVSWQRHRHDKVRRHACKAISKSKRRPVCDRTCCRQDSRSFFGFVERRDVLGGLGLVVHLGHHVHDRKCAQHLSAVRGRYLTVIVVPPA